jgi:hypothetical protein
MLKSGATGLMGKGYERPEGLSIGGSPAAIRVLRAAVPGKFVQDWWQFGVKAVRERYE